MNKRELRFISEAEVRLAGDDKSPVITGYAAVFNKPAQIMTRFQEVIRPGAFDRALKEKQDVRALFNHDDNQVLGRSKSGTLRMSVDSKGLKYEIDPPDTQLGRDLVTSIRRGDIDGSSFAFIVRGQKWNETTKDGVTTYLREITDCDLMDVSPVTYPAYEQTSVAVRTMFPDGEIEIPTPDPVEEKTSNDDWKERQELKLRIAEKV
jgi:HK97 family phage prohead protease